MPKVKKFPMLYKQASDGEKIIEWNIQVLPGEGDTGIIITNYGQKGGKKQTVKEVISVGKNIGRSNETTPYDQAVREAQSRWNVKSTRHNYATTIKDSGVARGRAPMLAYVYEDHADDIDWETAYVQPKLDGFRCIAECTEKGTVQLRSREGKPIETMGHIVKQLQSVMAKGEVLDGELYIYGEKFQKIASLIKKQREGSLGVSYHVYDVPTDAPFYGRLTTRNMILARAKLPTKGGRVIAVATHEVDNADELAKRQQKYLDKGYEGAMLRHTQATYEFGKRSKSLLKVKTFRDAEFVIVDFREGRGKCAGMCVFICRVPDDQDWNCGQFEVFAPGTAAEKRKAWKNRKLYLGKLITVKYQEMTTSEEPVPRFPVALRYPETL
jgi:ATP-dependent DNA ligase